MAVISQIATVPLATAYQAPSALGAVCRANATGPLNLSFAEGEYRLLRGHVPDGDRRLVADKRQVLTIGVETQGQEPDIASCNG